MIQLPVYPLVVQGGIILFDDYGTFSGETKVVDKFIAENRYRLRQFGFTRHPSYVTKGDTYE